MNFYPFHISDWALHTSHLTLEEEAVYRRLLDHYYDTEQPIPEETQPVIRRLRLGSHFETVSHILEEFFVLKADGWHNLRADEEIEAYNARAERARNNGKNGGRPKKNKRLRSQNQEETQPVNCGLLNETQKKANQEPITKNQKEGFALPPEVDLLVWDEFEQHRKSSAKLRKGWTDLARTKAANILKALTKEQQSECVNYSIVGGYPGLYPDRFDRRPAAGVEEPKVWYMTSTGIEKKAEEFGLQKTSEEQVNWPMFRKRVLREALHRGDTGLSDYLEKQGSF